MKKFIKFNFPSILQNKICDLSKICIFTKVLNKLQYEMNKNMIKTRKTPNMNTAKKFVFRIADFIL